MSAPAQAQIVHGGQACVVKEDNISERVYTIREGDTLVLQCLVTGHPRPQVGPHPACAAPPPFTPSHPLWDHSLRSRSGVWGLGATVVNTQKIGGGGGGSSWKMNSLGEGLEAEDLFA